MKTKKIEVELPEKPPAGSFSCCPSGDCAYDEAIKKWRKEVHQKILEAIPDGYNLKSSEIKQQKITRNYAIIVVEDELHAS